MPIDESSPYWSILADWLRVLLTLPDPPPEALTQFNDVAIFTAINALSGRLSPQVGKQVSISLAQVRSQLKIAS